MPTIADVKRRFREGHHGTVMPKPHIIWHQHLRQSGLYEVQATQFTMVSWPSVHEFVRDHIGKDRYTWTGHMFFFERSGDADMFRLYCT